MSTWTVYTSLGNALLSPFTATAGISSSLVAPALFPLIIAGLTIKIMWIGYETIRGKGSSNVFLDVFSNSLRAGLVMAIGLTAYQANVVGALDQLFGWLGGIFNPSQAVQGITDSSNTASLFSALDNAVNAAYTTFKSIYVIGMDSSHFSLNPLSPNLNGLVMIFCAGLMVVGFFIYTVVAFYQIFFIKLALIFLYAIGPLFVACFAFPSLSKWFDGWLSAVLRYGITGVVITMVTGMANGLLTTYATNMSNTALDTLDYFVFGGMALIGMIILAKFTTKVPELAGAMLAHAGIDIGRPSFGGVGNIAGYVKEKYQGAKADRVAAAKERMIETRHQELIKAASGGGANAGASAASSPGRDLVVDTMSKSMENYMNSGGGTGTISGSRPAGVPIQAMLTPNDLYKSIS